LAEKSEKCKGNLDFFAQEYLQKKKQPGSRSQTVLPVELRSFAIKFIIINFVFSYQGRTQGRGFGSRNPSLLEVNAMLLMAGIVKQLSNDSVHSGSNQTLKNNQ